MATVTQYWAPQANHNEIFQAWGTMHWWWPLGNGTNYWSFAIRPKFANGQVEIEREWTTSDNDLNWVEHFIVTASAPVGREFRTSGSHGTMLMFTAIKVE